MHPERMAWLAMRRFAPLREGGPPLPYSQLQSEFKDEFGDSVAIRTIQSVVVEAFKRNLVVLQKNVVMPDYSLETSVASILKARFSKLRDVLVVKTALTDTDHVHTQLGYALAEHIDKVKNTFRPRERIALGSGRAVFRTISALRNLPRVEVAPIYLHSRTGSLFPYALQAPASELLDGDTHVALFADHFDKDVETHTIRYSIAHSSKEERDEHLADTWLGNYETHKPDHVIVGVGALNLSEHRFNREFVHHLVRSRTNHTRISPALRPVAPQMIELLRDVLKIGEQFKFYSPIVADVCNRLFLVEPPHNIDLNDRRRIERTLNPRIEAVNDRLLTVKKGS